MMCLMIIQTNEAVMLTHEMSYTNTILWKQNYNFVIIPRHMDIWNILSFETSLKIIIKSLKSLKSAAVEEDIHPHSMLLWILAR